MASRCKNTECPAWNGCGNTKPGSKSCLDNGQRAAMILFIEELEDYWLTAQAQQKLRTPRVNLDEDAGVAT